MGPRCLLASLKSKDEDEDRRRRTAPAGPGSRQRSRIRMKIRSARSDELGRAPAASLISRMKEPDRRRPRTKRCPPFTRAADQRLVDFHRLPHQAVADDEPLAPVDGDAILR